MKFFASKQVQRVNNFALAALLVLSTITASVPFIFDQNANAVSGAVYSNVGLGGWVTDRTAPSGGVSQTTFDGRNVLAIGVVTPTDASSSFYQYEGIKKSIAATKTIKADLYVDASWPSNARVGIWGEGYDASNAISSYPIIEFNKSATTGWRIFDSAGLGGWREVAVPSATTGWNVIELAINKTDSSKTDIYVNGVFVDSSLGDPTENIKTIFLNNYNTGNGNYTVRWSNIQAGQYTPDAPTGHKFYKGTTEVAQGTILNVANGSKTVELKWQSTGAIDQYSTRVTYPDGTSEEHWTGTKNLWIGQTAYVTNKFGLKGDGVYKYETKARSATTGLWSDWSAPATLKFDGTAPAATVTANTTALPENTPSSTVVTIGGGQTTFQATLTDTVSGPQSAYIELFKANYDGTYGTWKKDNTSGAGNVRFGASPKLVVNLDGYTGKYGLKIVSQDAIGNAITRYHFFTVDSTAPNVPTNGLPNGTFKTDANNWNYTWSNEAASGAVQYEYQASRNGANAGGVLTAVEWNNIQNGNPVQQNLTTPTIPSVGTAEGKWYWQVRSIDAVGNKSAWSAIWDVTVDTIAPVAPVNGTPSAINVNDFYYGWDAVVDSGTPIVEYQFQVSNSDAMNGTSLASSWKNWTDYVSADQQTITTPQLHSVDGVDGTYFWQVRAIDAAGNVGAWSAVWTTVLDTSPATAPSNLRWIGTGGITLGMFTNVNLVTPTWTAPTVGTVSHYEYSYKAPGMSSWSTPSDVPATPTNIADQAFGGAGNDGIEGAWQFRLRTVNQFGVKSDWTESSVLTYDKTAPTVSFSTSDTTVGNDATFTIEGSTGDSASYVLSRSDSEEPAQTGTSFSSYDFATEGLESGEYTFTLVATDAAGNTSEPVQVTITVDNTSPEVELTAPTAAATGNIATFEIAGTTGDAVLYDLYVNGVKVVDQEPTEGLVEYTQTAAAGIVSTYTIRLVAFDQYGNEAEDTTELTVDNAAPALTITTVTSEGNTPTVTGTAEAGAVLSVTFNGVTSAIVNNAGVWSFTSPTALANGTYAFSITATDAVGNVTTGTTNVVVAVATFTVTPATISPAASAVLGDTTDNAAQNGATDVKGATDDKTAANSDANKGTIFGLAWYWWILILAALAALGWFIAGAIRRRNEDQA